MSGALCAGGGDVFAMRGFIVALLRAQSSLCVCVCVCVQDLTMLKYTVM